MRYNTVLESYYKEKIRQWQPTVLHRVLPAFIFGNGNFANIRKFVEDKGENGIINEFQHDSEFKIVSDIKNEITKDILLSVLSNIFNNDSSYSDIIDIIADATLDALSLL